MTLRPGDVIADRFVVSGDEGAVRNARLALEDVLWPRTPGSKFRRSPTVDPNAALSAVHDPVRRELEQLTNPELWLRGVDRTTGASVLIEPYRTSAVDPNDWQWKVVSETRARVVASVAPPYVVDLLHVGTVVVHAVPPAAAPRGIFSRPEAAQLALQACEVAARLHAAGIVDLPSGPFNLRVSGTGAHARIHWLVPGVGIPVPKPSIAHIKSGGTEELERWLGCGFDLEVGSDIITIIDFFLSLQTVKLGSLKDDAEEVALLHMLMGMGSSEPPSVASLARRLLSLVPASADASNRVAALPVVSAVPRLRFDWDHVIADGEAELARLESHRDFIGYPLAVAYHQRACRAWAAGDRSAALQDAERAMALDGNFLPYANTRAVMLDGLGRSQEARRVLDEALARVAAQPQDQWIRAEAFSKDGDTFLWGDDSTEVARAHATRGAASLRLGQPEQAAADLRRAMDLRPYGLYAHLLGAAMYSLGDFEAAAEAEKRSVELAPHVARYRWALVATLRRLGRDADSLEQAEAIIAMEPEDASHREKLLLLGRPDSQRRQEGN